MRFKKDRIILNSFWVICLIGLLNLNGMTAMIFSTTRIMSLGLLVLGIIVIFRYPKISNSLGRSGIACCGFFLFYLLLGNLVQRNLDLTISHCNSIFMIAVSAMATRKIVLSKGLPYFLKTILIIAVLGAWTVFLSPFLVGYYQNLWTSRVTSHAGRWLGFFANPNQTGMAGVLGLVVCLACWEFPAKKFPLKRFIPILVGITGVGILLTFSRSAIVLYAMLATGYAMVTFKLNKQTVGVLFGGVILIVISLWFFMGGYDNFEWSPQQLNRIRSVEKIIQGSAEGKDFGGRLNGVSGGLDYWSESPIVGHGLGSLHQMPYRYFRGLGCHNTHIMILGETGLVGFLPYLGFLGIFGWTAWNCKHPPIRTFSFSFFIVFLGIAMVSHGMLEDRNLNILLGVCFGLISVDKILVGQSNQINQPQFVMSKNSGPN